MQVLHLSLGDVSVLPCPVPQHLTGMERSGIPVQRSVLFAIVLFTLIQNAKPEEKPKQCQHHHADAMPWFALHNCIDANDAPY